MAAPLRIEIVRGFGGAFAEVVCFKSFHVFEPVDDPSTDFEIGGAFTGPPPALKCALTDIPAIGQFDLIEVFNSQGVLLGGCSKTWEENGGCGGRSRGGQREGRKEELILSEKYAIFLTSYEP